MSVFKYKWNHVSTSKLVIQEQARTSNSEQYEYQHIRSREPYKCCHQCQFFFLFIAGIVILVSTRLNASQGFIVFHTRITLLIRPCLTIFRPVVFLLAGNTALLVRICVVALVVFNAATFLVRPSFKLNPLPSNYSVLTELTFPFSITYI
ncbi:hypothetical protein BJ742DRAFT_143113 [Cladochytrium replicatum]|nr:hypothetical protein BJ742DRAFT_143113 [Cladochytrium replicatum]